MDKIIKYAVAIGIIIIASAIAYYVVAILPKKEQIKADQQQQAAKNRENKLSNCLQASANKYLDTQNSLCVQLGKNAGCLEFIGSPKDIEFTKIKQTDDQLCYNLYK